MEHRSGRWGVLAAAALLAAARWYLMSDPAHFDFLPAAWFWGETRSLTRAALNSGCSWLLLVLAPLVLLAALGRNNPGSWGLARPRLASPGLRWLIRALLPAAVLLGVAAVLWVPGVRESYPVFRAAGCSPGNLLLSGALTLALIAATELFYRGAALFALERGFGRSAVYLLLPIYVLDHVGAPGAELAGSALTGALLGHLALRTRSIWPGLAIHVACALSVDLVAALAIS